MLEEDNFVIEDEESLGKKICPTNGGECCGEGVCNCEKKRDKSIF